ncbi:RHS repeat-associated core domain-containing protein [Actinoplanes sp. NPDC051475]|uniref:RHS repeat-associated core domain-containing protein n=1 Tax=Actinoplanes sp. NPDC051475 TaxID=3157225 RepID=UPI00344C5707
MLPGKPATTADATSYTHGPNGDRLIRRDPTGAILYLPGGLEIRKPETGNAVGIRYYSHGGSTNAVRTPTALTWLVNDHQGTATATATVSSDASLKATRRRTLPFGEDRGTKPTSWAGDKGFDRGACDNTGLTHLGAREYDPSLGRFISVDPIMDLTDPQQWNPYSYADNTPISFTDPSGLTLGSAACAEGGGVACAGNESSGSGTNSGGMGQQRQGQRQWQQRREQRRPLTQRERRLFRSVSPLAATGSGRRPVGSMSSTAWLARRCHRYPASCDARLGVGVREGHCPTCNSRRPPAYCDLMPKTRQPSLGLPAAGHSHWCWPAGARLPH